MSEISATGRRIHGATPPGEAVPCKRRTPLNADEHEMVVEAIAKGREQRLSVALPVELHTRDWQSVAAVALSLDHRLGYEPAGWKIGAASEEVRRTEGLPGPAPGRLYRRTLFESPAQLPSSLFINYRNVECEFAFRLAGDLPPRIAPYTEDEVAASIDCLLPALEIGDTVFEDWYGASGYFGSCLDNGGGAAIVTGTPIYNWHDLDLSNTRIELRLNDRFVKDGFGRAAMGHPLTSITWLTSWLGEYGLTLRAGEIVSTGTCTGHCFVAPGDEVTAIFDGAGSVEAWFMP